MYAVMILTGDTTDKKIVYEAKLWLDSGKIFGKTGEGFQRINVAVPREIIKECLERILMVFSRSGKTIE